MAKNEQKVKKEVQEKYTELQLINQQIQQLQEQLSNIWQQIQELVKLGGSLRDMQKVKKGNKVLVPLGASIFVEGNVEETSKVIMGIGAGVCVKKDTEEAIEMVEDQVKELNNVEEQLGTKMEHLIAYAQNLQREMNKLIKE